MPFNIDSTLKKLKSKGIQPNLAPFRALTLIRLPEKIFHQAGTNQRQLRKTNLVEAKLLHIGGFIKWEVVKDLTGSEVKTVSSGVSRMFCSLNKKSEASPVSATNNRNLPVQADSNERNKVETVTSVVSSMFCSLNKKSEACPVSATNNGNLPVQGDSNERNMLKSAFDECNNIVCKSCRLSAALAAMQNHLSPCNKIPSSQERLVGATRDGSNFLFNPFTRQQIRLPFHPRLADFSNSFSFINFPFLTSCIRTAVILPPSSLQVITMVLQTLTWRALCHCKAQDEFLTHFRDMERLSSRMLLTTRGKLHSVSSDFELLLEFGTSSESSERLSLLSPSGLFWRHIAVSYIWSNLVVNCRC
ncbi:Uncharacterized protein TCM_036905 [Theobroma cacao]|uniref:KIB1-4 beta-propeller domain-containing protein n=1 Tax=Theobroma cacao TaxID=3641 RepID=A0A061GIU1_THECC|nr:Uncharacterized protein TCM_036905 [Theobroma cacao]